MRNSIIKRPWLVAMSAMTIALMAVAFLVATSFTSQAQASPDADNDGMMTNDLTVFTNGSAEHGWTTIDGLSGVMHKASWKDLVVDVSLECSLFTDTEVKSKGGNKDTSVAEAGVYVRVLVDGVPMPEFEPGVVTFCRRSQTLAATFQGLLENPDGSDDGIEDGTVCLSADPETGVITIDEDCLGYESVQLILDTTNANAFNFVYRDLPQGNYLIEVQAMISSDTSFQNGSADAWGAIGKGSAIVQEVRFAKTKS